MIDWSLLKNLEHDAVLRVTFPNASQLGDTFYCIGPEAYVETWHISDSKPGRGPFITFAAWAPSIGAARRVLFDDLSTDDGALGTPPDALLLESVCTSYVGVRRLAESGRFGQFSCADALDHPAWRYEIAVGDRLTYHFRHPDEPVCAISIDYRNIRWMRLC